MASRVVIGIEMGESTTKLVEFDHDSKTVLDIALKESDDIDDIKEFLLEKTGDATKEVECVFSIRSQNSIVRTVRIPKEIKDIDEYVRWELEGYICDSLDQYYYDAQILPDSTDDLYQQSMVVASRKVDVEGIIKQSRELAVPLGVVDMDVFSAINALEVMAEDIDIEQHNVIIKADQDGVAVIWSLNFLLEKMESILISIEAFSEGDFGDVTQEIETLLNSVVFSVRPPSKSEEGVSENEAVDAELEGVTPDETEGSDTGGKANIFVCGDLSENEDFMNSLKASVSQKLVKLNPFAFITMSPSCDKPELEAPCAAALGLAMRDSMKVRQ